MEYFGKVNIVRSSGAASLLVLLASRTVRAAEITNPIQAQEFRDIVARVANFAVQVMGPLAVIMVLLAGALYMTAGGNPDRLKRANRTLLWALVGIAVVLLARAAEFVIRDLIGVR